MSNNNAERLLCCRIMDELLRDRGSLASHLGTARQEQPSLNFALLQEYCYGLCRWYHRLDAWGTSLLDKPLRKKDQDLYCLILLGLYQLFHMRTPAHAAVNETVAAVVALDKAWAKGLVNAVLRNAQRNLERLQEEDSRDYTRLYSHPQWLLDRIKQDWPAHYRTILEANNDRAPMTLRVNRQLCSREDYLLRLQDAGLAASAGSLASHAIHLQAPVDVSDLPGFDEGLVSVQDEASQLLPALLPLQAGQRILDACAAPGGKTCALLEAQPGLQVLCVDNESRRLPRIEENLQRLQLAAEVRCADITQDAPADFTGVGGGFDTILLDVPCSATGVIRRHPDIKVLRSAAEIAQLCTRQAALLDAAWTLLAPGGHLMYSTCSVLAAENSQQIEAFLARQNRATHNAQEVPLRLATAQPCKHGQQLLPVATGNDGFFYALLQKG